MSQKMKDFQGNECAVSEQLYRLIVDKSELFGEEYRQDAQVKLIGGVDGHFNEPGYHFASGYVTITHPNASPAHFCGVKKSELELITDTTA
jgi:hypothetical protein